LRGQEEGEKRRKAWEKGGKGGEGKRKAGKGD